MRIKPIPIRIWEEHKALLKVYWLTNPSGLLKMKLMRRSSYPITKATLKDHAITTSPKPKPKAHPPKVEVKNRVKIQNPTHKHLFTQSQRKPQIQISSIR